MNIILRVSRWSISLTIAVLCWNALTLVLQDQPRLTVLFALMAIALVATVVVMSRTKEVETAELSQNITATEDIRLGSLLMGAGLATEDQIRNGLVASRCDGLKLGQALVTANYLSSEQLSRALIVQSLIRDGILDTYVGLAKLSSSKPILASDMVKATVKTIKVRSESEERLALLRRESEARLSTVHRKESDYRFRVYRR
jgi:hypothetical protein